MAKRKYPDSSLSDTPKAVVRQRAAKAGDDGEQEVAAPATEEPPAMQLGPSTSFSSSSEASQVELADLSAPESELVEETLSDEESRELDRLIQDAIAPWKTDGNEVYCAINHPAIIRAIVLLCSGPNCKYVEDSNRILNDYTWLPLLVNKCWEKGEFGMIRRLSECLLPLL
jgi:hypothetical protein